jgi:hypothetical protein
MFAKDFTEYCPNCETEFILEHDIDTEVINQEITCEECGCKLKVNSRVNIEIDSYVVFAEDD